MELGLLRDFFGNFSTQGERNYFCVCGEGGSMQDAHEVGMLMQGDFSVVEGTT